MPHRSTIFLIHRREPRIKTDEKYDGVDGATITVFPLSGIYF